MIQFKELFQFFNVCDENFRIFQILKETFSRRFESNKQATHNKSHQEIFKPILGVPV